MRHLTAFFCFSGTPTHVCAHNSRTTLRFKTSKSFRQTNWHMGILNLASNRSKSDFINYNLSPSFQSIGARNDNVRAKRACTTACTSGTLSARYKCRHKSHIQPSRTVESMIISSICLESRQIESHRIKSQSSATIWVWDLNLRCMQTACRLRQAQSNRWAYRASSLGGYRWDCECLRHNQTGGLIELRRWAGTGGIVSV
jgi:hypothetical protein